MWSLIVTTDNSIRSIESTEHNFIVFFLLRVVRALEYLRKCTVHATQRARVNNNNNILWCVLDNYFETPEYLSSIAFGTWPCNLEFDFKCLSSSPSFAHSINPVSHHPGTYHSRRGRPPTASHSRNRITAV